MGVRGAVHRVGGALKTGLHKVISEREQQMSERVAMLKDHWLACAIYWVVIAVVGAVSVLVYGSWGGRNLFAGFFDLSFLFIPVSAALAYAMAVLDARRRSSLPKSFRAKRYRVERRGVGWWVSVIGAAAWSIGGMLWVPDRGFIVVGMVTLMIQLGSKMGDAIYISTRDDP